MSNYNLSQEQKDQLKDIISYKPSFGAFSGMIFNAKLSHPDKSFEELVKLSMDAKSAILEASK